MKILCIIAHYFLCSKNYFEDLTKLFPDPYM